MILGGEGGAGDGGLRDRRVLVTGAGGFIGDHVCRRLVRAGAEVHGSGRGAPPRAGAEGVAWSRLDVTDEAAVRRLAGDLRPEVVMHLAGRVSGARDPAQALPMLRANLAGTVHVLAAAHAVGARVVLAGSMEEPFPGEPVDVAPRSPYAASKWAAAAYARMYGLLWSLPVAVLRPSMVYGPGQADETKLVPHTILAMLRGEAPRLAGGRRLSDWVHVSDVADAFLAAPAAAGPRAPTVDVGSGEMASVAEVVERLAAIIAPGVAPAFGARPDPPREAGRPADLEGAAAVLGWRARVGLEEGLRDTVRWYRERLAN